MIRESVAFFWMEKLTKDEITFWLRQHNRNRRWLAEQCGVSEGTINNGFSAGFSDSILATIEKLMKLDELAANQPGDDAGMITFTTTEFERIEKARAAVGSPDRPQFYREAIMQFVADTEASEGRMTDGPARGDAVVLAAENAVGSPEAAACERQPVQYPTGKKGKKG
jgi:hypothetical protein